VGRGKGTLNIVIEYGRTHKSIEMSTATPSKIFDLSQQTALFGVTLEQCVRRWMQEHEIHVEIADSF
jgi:hypothetical protein